MKILAIDTSCDETAAAVTRGTTVLSNVIWSQAFQHAEFGGVMPSLAQRMHEERIDWVVSKAITKSQIPITKLDAVAVTSGPGLAIALGVGITKAKELAGRLNIPLIPVNHIEGHLLSPMAEPSTKFQVPTSPTSLKLRGDGKQTSIVIFPALGLVVSGGHTELVLIKEIGNYQILAKTQDDALGEALDKAARMLGLGYPGGAILEKMAKFGDSKSYTLPMPMSQSPDKHSFSYSGLKTALLRLSASEGQVLIGEPPTLNKRQICDLAASFQNRAFQHLIRVISQTITDNNLSNVDLLVGGGVVANIDLRNRLRKMGKELGLKVRFPYSKKLIGDNAAMIGVAAGLKIKEIRNMKYEIGSIDRKARWAVDQDFSRE